jgi:polysaccharide export outer membrane protein
MRVVSNMKTLVLMLICCLSVVIPSWADTVQDDYLIGADDVLKITVYDHQDLDVVSRVSGDGSIQFPLLGSVTLGGLTIKDAIKEIETQLKDGYLVNPQVTIFVEEYRSKKVMVIGHVVEPGVLELSGPTHLLEVLSLVGGLRENASDEATITRNLMGDEKGQKILRVDLKRLMETGNSELNVQIMDKDSVFIAKAGMFYVTGEVGKPDAYKYEEGSTVLKAISMAGGFTQIAAKNKIRIVRIVDGKEQTLEKVTLQEEVKPGDVVVVPESYF